MRRRLFESLGVATVITTVMVLLHLTAVPVGGEAPSATVWGHPNLVGIWLDVYSTPFERAAELGDREFATAEDSVAQVIGYSKGKSAIYIAREFAGRSRSFVGQYFWARGYFVSPLGRDERAIRAYIRAQEQEDRRQEQLWLDESSHP